MESKYYTPDITEFHVGFEYLVKSIEGNRLIELDINVNHNFKYLQESITREEVLVKYLDQSDIESLGFECDDVDEPYDFTGKRLFLDKFNIIMGVNYNTHWVEIRTYFVHGEEILFQGNVKNKSELKKILKQIGYETK